MALYRGIPFDGGMDSPTGTGAQHIVQTCQAICDWFQDGTAPGKLIDNATNLSVDWNNRQGFDAALQTAIDWGGRQLIDASSAVSIDWGSYVLYGGSGTLSIDWQGRVLIDSAGTNVVEWANQQLIDALGNVRLDWTNGDLNFLSGAPAMTFGAGIGFYGHAEASQQAGAGAVSAGAVYTATERAMLNAVYAGMRAYGLLT